MSRPRGPVGEKKMAAPYAGPDRTYTSIRVKTDVDDMVAGDQNDAAGEMAVDRRAENCIVLNAAPKQAGLYESVRVPDPTTRRRSER